MLQLIVGLICATVLPIYFLIPESPRWLAQNGKEDEALKVIFEMAKMNKKVLNENDERIIEKTVKEIAASEKTENTSNPLEFFRHGQLKKTIILSLAWICVCVSYYALSLNSSDLSGDIYINFFLSRTTVLFTIPAILGPSIYFGLRFSLASSQIILGLSCIILAFIPKENSTAVLVVYLFANLVASTSKP